MTAADFDKLKAFRKHLHRKPELSGNESHTADAVVGLLKETNPTAIYRHIGGHGIVAVYDTGKTGPNIGFRSELDALPIPERNNFDHASLTPGVSHKCGHDGHMAIVAGLGFEVLKRPLKRGKLTLLFQPAEETGFGAAAMLREPSFRQLLPHQLFALHNVPGHRAGKVLSRSGIVCPASEGIIFELSGKTSHAGQPEKGNNPASVIAAIQAKAQEMHDRLCSKADRTKLTTVHMQLGSRDFGVNPGNGTIAFTLRSDSNEQLDAAKAQLTDFAAERCKASGIQLHITPADPFKTVVNSEESLNEIKAAADVAGLAFEQMANPFPWSEDFGRFSEVTSTGFFGLGAGENTPELHHDTYDFPDELIPIGISLFCQLAGELWREV